MNFFSRFTRNVFESIADAGENFLDLTGLRGTASQTLTELSLDLISHKGVASGIALAREVVSRYEKLDNEEKVEFFKAINASTQPNLEQIKKSATAFIKSPDEQTLKKLGKSIQPKQIKLFSRMNMAPGGTLAIVNLRQDLLELLPTYPELKPVDETLRVLLTSWFNPGFLVLKKIDWETEASILEKIIQNETVHNIENWNDLKQRLTNNRRCFAWFHPALEDDPLIFVEVALTRGISSSIQSIISETKVNGRKKNTAIFYSINNCQKGLRGIPLGNFLIKMAAHELNAEISSIKKYSSLSPVTGFAQWLMKNLEAEANELKLLKNKDWYNDQKISEKLKNPLRKACAHYLVNVKENQKPVNSVARFHFGNGAELYRINWMGNTSVHGLTDSFGLMVNYRYDLKNIESNHENYIRKGELAVSNQVKKLLG